MSYCLVRICWSTIFNNFTFNLLCKMCFLFPMSLFCLLPPFIISMLFHFLYSTPLLLLSPLSRNILLLYLSNFFSLNFSIFWSKLQTVMKQNYKSMRDFKYFFYQERNGGHWNISLKQLILKLIWLMIPKPHTLTIVAKWIKTALNLY